MGQCRSRSRLTERDTQQPIIHHLLENESNMGSLDSSTSSSFDRLLVSTGGLAATRTLQKPKSWEDFLALTYKDDEKVTHSTSLPSVRYSPGLEYDQCIPPLVVKDIDRAPQIDDILGTYDILMNTPLYEKYLISSSDDEESLIVTHEDDGCIKFEIVCRRVENSSGYMGWTYFGEYRFDCWRGALPSLFLPIGSQKSPYLSRENRLSIDICNDPYPENYMGERSGKVHFIHQRGATFYSGKEHNREKTRCQPIARMDHAEKKLADFAKARCINNNWIHRRLGLPVEVAAEVQKFLMAPMPPPVFFFEKGDLVLDVKNGDSAYVRYVARKSPRHAIST